MFPKYLFLFILISSLNACTTAFLASSTPTPTNIPTATSVPTLLPTLLQDVQPKILGPYTISQALNNVGHPRVPINQEEFLHIAKQLPLDEAIRWGYGAWVDQNDPLLKQYWYVLPLTLPEACNIPYLGNVDVKKCPEGYYGYIVGGDWVQEIELASLMYYNPISPLPQN
ncbi:MAG: hypothetical protein M1282_18050 [Chloroflexi bacterium]|nr:hypothetical protein [Chloroflexota bacterium]